MSRNYSRDYQERPARKQTQNLDTTGSFNIWYSKWSAVGDVRDKGTIPRAETRCCIDRDAGRTKASKNTLVCIHFCHGKCTRGADCTYLHRLPMEGDQVENTKDCFGRDKFRAYREDMGGVGSFEKQNHTVYVGNVDINDSMESSVRKHFSEWGKIDSINVLGSKGVAFVQYERLANAEFAKEAMYGQSLDGEEILNCRWATEDPNPGVQAAKKRKAEETVTKAILSRLPQVGDQGSVQNYSDGNPSLLGTQGQIANPEEAAAAYYEYYASFGYHPRSDGTWAYIPPTFKKSKIESSASAPYAIKRATPSSHDAPISNQDKKPVLNALISGYGSSGSDDES